MLFLLVYFYINELLIFKTIRIIYTNSDKYKNMYSLVKRDHTTSYKHIHRHLS